jgi:hypothetical protein
MGPVAPGRKLTVYEGGDCVGMPRLMLDKGGIVTVAAGEGMRIEPYYCLQRSEKAHLVS